MEKFAEHTVPGAAFDDRDRDPPPRCHPGTRLTILERLERVVIGHERDKRMTWLVGPAGVGKSAIMQTLAETPYTNVALGASLFFSNNGRDDGSKTFTTIAYQIAVRSQPYQDFVQAQVANDATLWRKSIARQFEKFIFEPFVVHKIRPEGRRDFLILIDGLDECSDQRIQCEILGLISYFSIKYPAAPLVWVIASRPEPHITSFLSRTSIAAAIRKETLKIDSDEAHRDVERYLRAEFGKLPSKYPCLAHSTQWPQEREFLKVSHTSRGLFAYAHTVVAYINDPDPISRFQEVLDTIEDMHSHERELNRNPLANLDKLYKMILSRIPEEVLVHNKRILLFLLRSPLQPRLSDLCNQIGMAPNIALSSLHHLYSVLDLPSSFEAAARHTVTFQHKSFRDYLRDFGRSGMYSDLNQELVEFELQFIRRIHREIPRSMSQAPHSLIFPTDALR